MHGIVRAAGLSVATWLAAGVAHAQPGEPPGSEPTPDVPDGEPTPAGEAAPPEAQRAQVPDEAPPEPVPNVPAASTYPREHVARPLVLPEHAIEGSGRLTAYRSTFAESFGLDDSAVTAYLLTPGVRAGLSGIEVEATFDLFLLQSSSELGGGGDPDRLQAFFIAARLRRSPDTSVGLALAALNITTEFSAIEPTLTLGRKAHLSSTSAFVGELGFGFQQQSVGGGSSVKSVLLEWNGRIQAQVVPAVAVEGRVSMRYLDGVSGETEFGFDPASIRFRVGAGVVAAVSPTFDVFASVDLADSGDIDTKIFTIGAMGRRAP